eukprot:3529767-Amphidinium_carterae.1
MECMGHCRKSQDRVSAWLMLERGPKVTATATATASKPVAGCMCPGIMQCHVAWELGLGEAATLEPTCVAGSVREATTLLGVLECSVM